MAQAFRPLLLSRMRFCSLVLLLAAAVVIQVLALATDYFQSSLNSDYLLAEIFSRALSDPNYPISGWKFGSAGFFFPDYFLYLPSRALVGDEGLAYPVYAVVVFLLLGTTMAWSLAAAGVEQKRAVLSAGVTLLGLLLLQYAPGHGDWLWRMGVPAYHGGTLVCGFALLALVLGAVRSGWTRARSVSVVALVALGGLSNALLLVHWLAPMILVWGWEACDNVTLKVGWRHLLGLSTVGIGLIVGVRGSLALAEFFFFAPLVRDWPTPSAIWQTVSVFVESVTSGAVWRNQWAFWLVLVAAIVVVAARRGGPRSGGRQETAIRIATRTAWIGMLLAWFVIMVAAAWKDGTNLRYLLNWFVVPAWLLALHVARLPRRLPLAPLVVAVSIGAIFVGGLRVEPRRLVLPTNAEAAELRAYLEAHQLREGLADYWHGHLLSALWRFEGPRLSHVRDKDFAYFWCNNAFGFFPTREEGGLGHPAPQFVLLAGLERARLQAWLGGEPLQIDHVAGYDVAVLTTGQSGRAGELIEAQARQLLVGRRARWLDARLPALDSVKR